MNKLLAPLRRSNYPCLILATLFATLPCAADAPTTKPSTDCKSARECWLRGNYERAVALYEELGKKDAVRAGCGIAEIDRLTGEYEAGIAKLNSVEDRGKNSPQWHACLASLLAEVGRYEEAVQHNRRALELDEEQFRARCQLGELYEMLGQAGPAREAYQHFDDVMTGATLPDSAEDLLYLGRGFYRYGTLTRHPDVVQRTRHVLTEVYQEAFEFVDSLFWPARLAGAELLLEKHQLKEAKEDFERILQQNPKVADAMVGLGVIALEDWDFDEVQKQIDAALRANPNHVAARMLLARMRLTERKYQEAADASTAALKVNPNSIEALSLLAAANLRLGEESASNEARQRIVKINAKPAVLHYELGKWLSAGRQFAEAEEHFKKAVEFAPTWSDPLTDLGQLYMETGEETPARRTLEAAFALDSFNMHTHNVLQLLDSLDKFARLETEHFIIKYHAKEDAVVAPYLGEALEAIYPEVCADFDAKLEKKTIIEMFPDHMGFSVRITGRPFIATVGACTGRVIAFTAPRGRPPFGRFNWAGVMRHEFTHTVTLAMTENRIPHWMTEGLAVHEEPLPRTWATKQMLASAFRKGELFDLQSIDWGFMRPRRANDRQLAYAQSEWMVEYITARWSFKAILDLLAAFRAKKPQEAAFGETLKIPTSEFVRDFKEWAGEQIVKWGLPTEAVDDPEKLQEQLDDAAEENGEKSKSRKVEKRGAEGSPEEARLLGRLSKALLAEGEIKPAEQAARRALKKNKDEPDALETISVILIHKMLEEEKDSERTEFIDEVNPYLRRLITLRPENPAAIKYLGFVEQAWGQYPEAISWLTKYQKRFPDDPDSYRRLAGIALAQKNVGAALPQLERLAQLAAEESAVAMQIGRIYMEKTQPAIAARWFRRAIDIDPYDPDIHGALADAQLQAGNHAAAEVEYQVVCKLLPDEGIGYDGLSAVYKAMGQKEKSEEYAARAAALGKRP